jgi:hypothetical protein
LQVQALLPALLYQWLAVIGGTGWAAGRIGNRSNNDGQQTTDDRCLLIVCCPSSVVKRFLPWKCVEITFRKKTPKAGKTSAIRLPIAILLKCVFLKAFQ